jgi:Flp pilus assembly protein TadD
MVTAALLSAVFMAAGCESTQSPPVGDSYASHQQLDDQFAKGLHRAPTPATLYSMARLLEAQQKDAQAEYVLQRVIKEYPQFLPAYVELSGLYMRRGMVDKAMEILQAGRQVAPNDALLANNIGMCWLVKDQPETALTSFNQAVELDPNNARYLSNKATAQGLAGQYEDALDTYMQVVREDQAHYNLAVVCEARKDYERAKAEFEIARTLKAQGRWYQ